MKEIIEIARHNEGGFKPLVSYMGWRVAVLNSYKNVKKESFYKVERHTETDEAFVLLKGYAWLIIGEGTLEPQNMDIIKMEYETVYNVKKGVWHHIIMQEASSVVIVENKDTSPANTEYYELGDVLKLKLLKTLEDRMN